MVDWTLLPKDLLERINGCFETFDMVHFRSVCSSWRSAVPPSSRRLGFNSILPIFNDNPRFKRDKHCILKKIPVFLMRFQTPFDVDYLFVGMSESESDNQELLLPLPNFCLKSKYGIVLNTLGSQIIPLGHCYKINFYAITTRRYRTRRESYSNRAAFLQVDSEDGRDFAVVAGVLGVLMMYRSCDKKWTEIEGRLNAYPGDMVSYKGKFYVVDKSGRGHVFVIEPSLEVNEIHPVTQTHKSFDERLIVSGDELLLVQRITPGRRCQEHRHTWFKLFRLEEEGQRRWVRINDLKDRVLFLGHDWNLCYSAKELPGMRGNCILFITPNDISERILLFDLRSGKTSKALTEGGGYMGAFGENGESLVSCGIVKSPIPAISMYDSSINVIWPPRFLDFD